MTASTTHMAEKASYSCGGEDANAPVATPVVAGHAAADATHYPSASFPVAGIPTAGHLYPSTNGGINRGYPQMAPPHHVGGAMMYAAGHQDLGMYDGRVFSPESQQYTTNLFDCTDDVPSCFYGTFCTVCQVGESAQQAKAGGCCATSFILVGLAQLNHVVPFLGSILAGGFLATTANRAALNYGVTEHTDLATACFCAPCVSCRLAREVKNRAEMGQEPVDVIGAMQMGAMMGQGGTMMIPPPPVMVRNAHPPQQDVTAGGGRGGADTMVTYVAVMQPPSPSHSWQQPASAVNYQPPSTSVSSAQQQQPQPEGPQDKL